MKRLFLAFFIAMSIITVSSATEKNPGENPGIIFHNNADNRLGSYIGLQSNNSPELLLILSGNVIRASSSKIPEYSYFYDGENSIIDLICFTGKEQAKGDIFIKFNKDTGIQSVTGKCQGLVHGNTVYISPVWDGYKFGVITFNSLW